MPIDRESGKDRWQRVPKDYFKHPDRLQRTRLWLAAAAVLVATGWWWAGGATYGEAGRYRASRGPVARVHAAWDTRCDACHVPFDGRSLLATFAPATDSAKGDALCSSCHQVGAHHRATIAAEVPGCAECHRDHRGRDASLVRLADPDCTRCHGDLGSHIAKDSARPKERRAFGDVLRFDRDHPPFRPEAATFVADKPLADRSRLKFNHALHMRPGLVAKAGDTPYTVARIPIAEELPRYRGGAKADSEPVRLECASCHVLEPGGSGYRPGRYYEPVAYETSCRACHALSFDPRSPDLMAPHGKPPAEVAAFVRQTYAAQFLADDPRLLDAFVPAATIPGKAPEAVRTRDRLDDAVKIAESLLFENTTNCLECHHAETADGEVVPRRIEPTNVPKVWFAHAQFDHSAHRAVSCRDCHARAYALDADGKTPVVNASIVNTDVLLPDIANCRQCHGPARSGGWLTTLSGATTAGASQDCVECHRYHDGDRPAHGPGPPAKDATTPRSIAEFLAGAAAKPAPLPR